MSNYKHQRGVIQDNSLKALIRDPLFHQRIERNKKGKGSYSRKNRNGGKTWEAGSKLIVSVSLEPAFC